MGRRLSTLAALPILALGLLTGCGGSSTEPVEAPLIFEGEIASLGAQIHNFTVLNAKFIRVELVRLQEKAVEGEEPLGLNLTLGLGLGRPAENACSTRSSVLAKEGQVLVVSLSAGEFCVRLFDNGALVPGRLAEYTLSVSPG